MQTAAATLSGNAKGAGDDRRLSQLSRVIIPLEVGLMVFSGGLLFLFAPSLMRLFSHDPDVLSLGSIVLRMVAVSEPFYGVPIVIEGMMQGLGKTKAPFFFLCTQILGGNLISAWGCMIAHNLLLFVLFGVHYLTGRWKK